MERGSGFNVGGAAFTAFSETYRTTLPLWSWRETGHGPSHSLGPGELGMADKALGMGKA